MNIQGIARAKDELCTHDKMQTRATETAPTTIRYDGSRIEQTINNMLHLAGKLISSKMKTRCEASTPQRRDRQTKETEDLVGFVARFHSSRPSANWPRSVQHTQCKIEFIESNGLTCVHVPSAVGPTIVHIFL